MKFIDLTGQRFGKLTVLNRVENGKDGGTRYLYFGDQRVGTLSKCDSIPTIEPQGELTFGERPADFRFTASIWRSCRTRKRFIKLMMGIFGIQRNRAVTLAEIAMRCGCPSYQDMWADYFTFLIKEMLKYMVMLTKADTLETGSE